jgi:hypothetical protein
MFGMVPANHGPGWLEAGAIMCGACGLARWWARHRQGSVPGPSSTVASRWHVSGPTGMFLRDCNRVSLMN